MVWPSRLKVSSERLASWSSAASTSAGWQAPAEDARAARRNTAGPGGPRPGQHRDEFHDPGATPSGPRPGTAVRPRWIGSGLLRWQRPQLVQVRVVSEVARGDQRRRQRQRQRQVPEFGGHRCRRRLVGQARALSQESQRLLRGERAHRNGRPRSGSWWLVIITLAAPSAGMNGRTASGSVTSSGRAGSDPCPPRAGAGPSSRVGRSAPRRGSGRPSMSATAARPPSRDPVSRALTQATSRQPAPAWPGLRRRQLRRARAGDRVQHRHRRAGPVQLRQQVLAGLEARWLARDRARPLAAGRLWTAGGSVGRRTAPGRRREPRARRRLAPGRRREPRARRRLAPRSPREPRASLPAAAAPRWWAHPGRPPWCAKPAVYAQQPRPPTRLATLTAASGHGQPDC